MFLAIFNALEAAFWGALAMFMAIRSRKLTGRRRTVTRVAAVLLFLFGFSDIIEIFTGAWWEPLALLVLKAGCVIGLAGCGWCLRPCRKQIDLPNP